MESRTVVVKCSAPPPAARPVGRTTADLRCSRSAEPGAARGRGEIRVAAGPAAGATSSTFRPESRWWVMEARVGTDTTSSRGRTAGARLVQMLYSRRCCTLEVAEDSQ